MRNCGLLVGNRTGGDGNCPYATATAGVAIRETHRRVCLESPVAEMVWEHVLLCWHGLGMPQVTQQPHGRARAVLLGLLDMPSRHVRDAFELLCALVLLHLVQHRNMVAMSLANEEPLTAADTSRVQAGALVYERVRHSLQEALQGEYIVRPTRSAHATDAEGRLAGVVV